MTYIKRLEAIGQSVAPFLVVADFCSLCLFVVMSRWPVLVRLAGLGYRQLPPDDEFGIGHGCSAKRLRKSSVGFFRGLFWQATPQAQSL